MGFFEKGDLLLEFEGHEIHLAICNGTPARFRYLGFGSDFDIRKIPTLVAGVTINTDDRNEHRDYLKKALDYYVKTKGPSLDQFLEWMNRTREAEVIALNEQRSARAVRAVSEPIPMTTVSLEDRKSDDAIVIDEAASVALSEQLEEQNSSANVQAEIRPRIPRRR